MVTTDEEESTEDLVSVSFSAAFPYGGGSCIYWRGMSLEAKAELLFITGPNIGRRSKGLTSQRYIEEILVDHVVPFSG